MSESAEAERVEVERMFLRVAHGLVPVDHVAGTYPTTRPKSKRAETVGFPP